MDDRYEHIKDIMTNDCSGFTFVDGCEYELSPFSTYTCSQTEIESKVLRGVIAVSDYFILYALICLGHATPEMVNRYLNRLRVSHPDMLIPGRDIDGTKSRLKTLSSYGVVRCFSYKVAERSSPLYIYCISEGGGKLVQRGLFRDCTYDVLCSTETIMLVLRRAVCNYIGTLMLQQNKWCHEYLAKASIHLGKGEKMQSYGRLYYKVQDNDSEHKYVCFIEPIFFSYDARIMDAKGNLAAMKSRLVNYDRHFKFLSDKYEGTYLIICVENWGGLVKSVQLIQQSAPDLLDVCFFVCDRVVYVNGDSRSIADSCLQVSIDGNVLRCHVAEHPVIFGNNGLDNIPSV